MSFFIAKLEKKRTDDKILSYLRECGERKSQAFLENNAKLYVKSDCVYWFNVIDVKLPPIYYLSVIFFVLYLLFGGWGWFIPMIFFASTSLIYWKQFHIFAFKKGLRKKGYEGNIQIVSVERGMLEAVFN